MEPSWLLWARELQAIAQTGLEFAKDPYDRERYIRIRALAARMMAQAAGADAAWVEELFAGQFGYATPKVDVRGAVIRDDGRILLVREVADSGRWSLPGGWAEVNQSPREAVVREVLEETGFAVSVRKLAAVYDRARHPHLPPRPFHVYKLFFVCEIVGGTAQTSRETSEVAFFAEDEVPSDLSIARVLPYQITRMFEHARFGALPTDVD
jgi:ADP-ribose pyrophosphatase YjhB (NUDIX family)